MKTLKRPNRYNQPLYEDVFVKEKGLEKEGIFIKSYSDLLAEARRYNDDLYKMYEDISMKKNNKSDK